MNKTAQISEESWQEFLGNYLAAVPKELSNRLNHDRDIKNLYFDTIRRLIQAEEQYLGVKIKDLLQERKSRAQCC